MRLVASIRANGLLQPIAVFQPDQSVGQYTLIAGERRWRAIASHLGMTTQRVHMLAAIGANEPVRIALAEGQLKDLFAHGLISCGREADKCFVRPANLPGAG